MRTRSRAPKTRQEYLPYIRFLAERFGLKDWAFEVMDDQPENCVASVYTPHGQKVAKVYLSDHHFKDTLEEQRSTIVHELIHCHFAPMNGLVANWLEGHSGDAYNRTFEYGVDGLAVAIAPMFPLPFREDPTVATKKKPAKKQPPKKAETTKRVASTAKEMK